jgi:hypothetical protein
MFRDTTLPERLQKDGMTFEFSDVEPEAPGAA